MQVPKNWREIPHRYRMESGKCTKCQKILFPKRLICPECGSKEFETLTLSGKGKLVTKTVINIGVDGHGDLAPYAVAIVELEEGLCVMAQVADCDPNSLKIGDNMVTQFRKMGEEGKTGMLIYGYKFVPELGL